MRKLMLASMLMAPGLLQAADFNAFDVQVHDQAMALAEAAEAVDRDRMLQHYSSMMEGCLACHARFRETIRALSDP